MQKFVVVDDPCLGTSAKKLNSAKPVQRLAFHLAVAMAVTAGSALAATKTWNGGTGNWNDAAMWTPSGVPAATDTVIFDGGTINLTGPVTHAGLMEWSRGTLVAATVSSISDGEVIHQPRGSDLGRSLPGLVNNFGTRIKSGPQVQYSPLRTARNPESTGKAPPGATCVRQLAPGQSAHLSW